jgi:hypothetical protein
MFSGYSVWFSPIEGIPSDYIKSFNSSSDALTYVEEIIFTALHGAA